MKELIQKIGIDKIYHFGVCFVLAIMFGIYGVIAGQSAGIGKEYGDRNSPINQWSWGDLLANAIGSAIGYIGYYFIVEPFLYNNFITN